MYLFIFYQKTALDANEVDNNDISFTLSAEFYKAHCQLFLGLYLELFTVARKLVSRCAEEYQINFVLHEKNVFCCPYICYTECRLLYLFPLLGP